MATRFAFATSHRPKITSQLNLAVKLNWIFDIVLHSWAAHQRSQRKLSSLLSGDSSAAVKLRYHRGPFSSTYSQWNRRIYTLKASLFVWMEQRLDDSVVQIPNLGVLIGPAHRQPALYAVHSEDKSNECCLLRSVDEHNMRRWEAKVWFCREREPWREAPIVISSLRYGPFIQPSHHFRVLVRFP